MNGFTKYVRNGATLTLSSLLMQTASLFFNAYVGRAVGGEGMGLYALVVSVYGFAATFSSAGLSLTVTRLVAEAIGKKEEDRISGVMHAASVYALLFSSLAFLTVFFFAPTIATRILGDYRTLPSLRLLSFSLLPIALSSVLSGYFSATRAVLCNASVKVFEWGLRMLFTFLGLLFLSPLGTEYAVFSLVGGSSLAELFSFAVSFLQYRRDRKNAVPQKRNGSIFPSFPPPCPLPFLLTCGRRC